MSTYQQAGLVQQQSECSVVSELAQVWHPQFKPLRVVKSEVDTIGPNLVQDFTREGTVTLYDAGKG